MQAYVFFCSFQMRSLLSGRPHGGGPGSIRSSGVCGQDAIGSGFPGLERQASRISAASSVRGGTIGRRSRSRASRDGRGRDREREAELKPASLSSTSSTSCIGTLSGNSNQMQMQVSDPNSQQQFTQLLNNGAYVQQTPLPQVLVNGGSIGGGSGGGFGGSSALTSLTAPVLHSTLRRQRSAAAGTASDRDRDREERDREPQSTPPDFSDSADSRLSSGTGPSSTFHADPVAVVGRPPRLVSPISAPKCTSRSLGLHLKIQINESTVYSKSC